MQYLSVAEARERAGLRLVLTAGVPGPWGEAAKAIFHVKGIAYAPVRQLGGLPNEELLEWTGHDNAPIAIYEDERPRALWSEILHLAERLEAEPPLIPAGAADRALMFGLAHEICGENGFAWCRRLALMGEFVTAGGPLAKAGERLARKYGYSPEAAAAAPAHVAQILELLSERLREQRAARSDYFVGDRLSALDLYWATFAALLEPLPHELCPMPPPIRASYELREPDVRKAADPVLLEHRDRIYETYLPLPLDF